MKAIKKVSIIIPVYNVEKYLEGSVQSALNQTYTNLNIILIDDGSTDTSSAMCDKFAEEYQNIKVFHKKNGGLSSARNMGLKQVGADTDFVLFLDSDDQLISTAIEDMVQCACQDDAEIVYPDRYIKTFEDQRQELCFHFPESMYIHDPKKFALEVLIQEGRAWRAHSLLYSYPMICRANALFPEGRIAEDFSFNVQVLAEARKITFYTKPTVLYLKRKNSITTSFQRNFDKDIWFIDQKAREFLQRIHRDDASGVECADALLCRNIVTYLFSIMSNKNTMTYSEKTQMARKLLDDPNAKNVVRGKHKTPYFNKKSARIAMNATYFLLRNRMDAVAFRFMLTLSSIKSRKSGF